MYRILDENKQPVGVPIKASLFYNKPTLKYLEDHFKINDALRQPDKSRLKSAIDFALLHGHQTTLQDMISELRRKGFDTVLRQNDEGRIYGITFVDHIKKSVWNGSDLGKQYSAKELLERCGVSVHSDLNKASLQVHQHVGTVSNQQQKESFDSIRQLSKIPVSDASNAKGNNILDQLMQPEYGGSSLPSEWKKRRKKKKRGQSNNM